MYQGPPQGPPYGGGYGPPQQQPQYPQQYPPQPYYQPPPQPFVVVQNNVIKAPFNHTIHIILDVVTCGGWLIIHLICWAVH